MMKKIREIIKIDEEKCDGCGLCIPGCPEGALQVIDGKARLVSDLMCDGLGACLGECPLNAITIEKREAEEYNETEVIKDQLSFNLNEMPTIKNQPDSPNQTFSTKENPPTHHPVSECGCPGAATKDFREKETGITEATNDHSCHRQDSQLRQWPIQLHLVNPLAPYFKNSDLLLAADCVAFAIGDFHTKHLKGRAVAIACPKLDSHQDAYIDKLTRMIEDSNINTITVMIMEVPCCGGLLQMAMAAVQAANRKVPVKMLKVGLRGEILAEAWI